MFGALYMYISGIFGLFFFILVRALRCILTDWMTWESDLYIMYIGVKQLFEVHFCFINSFMQSSLLRSLRPSFGSLRWINLSTDTLENWVKLSQKLAQAFKPLCIHTSPNYYCASNLHNKRPEVPVELVYVALLGLSRSSPQLGAQCCFVYLFYFMTFDTEIRLPEKKTNISWQTKQSFQMLQFSHPILFL